MTGSMLLAFVISLAVALTLVITARHHRRWTADAPGSGPQKLHRDPIPRVGGFAIMAGFAVALTVARLQVNNDGAPRNVAWVTGWFVVALFIPFAAGLLEDLTKVVGARWRLLATFAGAAAAWYFCGAQLTRFAVPPLDAVMAVHPAMSFVATLFCVGAIANAFNLSDGLNGLLAGLSIAACTALAFAAHSVGDVFMAIATLSLAAAVAGFAVFNFPRARLFCGDGGAYLLGSAVSLFAILLCARHTAISPWFAFALVLYPFMDTSAAIVRRLIRRKPIMSPDADHLHTLLSRAFVKRYDKRGHAIASSLIVTTAGAAAALATALRHDTGALVILCACAAALYGMVYMVLIRAHPFRAANPVTHRQ